MSLVYLLLGTNLGDKKENLLLALEKIQQSGQTIIKTSKVHETAPWGFQHPESFYNQAVAIQTILPPQELMTLILEIEKTMGRERKMKGYEARIIDIDIILYDDCVIQTETVTIPHPMMHLRRFVLVPLCEIASQAIHPITKLSVSQLLQECSDYGTVKRLEI